MFEYKEESNPLFKRIAWGFVPFIMLFFGMTFISLTVDSDGEIDRSRSTETFVVNTTFSPDHRHKAVVYAGREIGTTKWSFVKVLVQASDESFYGDEDTNVLEIDGESNVTPIWDGNSNLVVIHTILSQAANQSPKISTQDFSPETGITIKHIEDRTER